LVYCSRKFRKLRLRDSATPGPIFQRYVEDYADHFEIRSHIRLGGRVTGLAPRANRAAGWTVSIEEEGGGTYKEDFDLVVIATGLFFRGVRGLQILANKLLESCRLRQLPVAAPRRGRYGGAAPHLM
jgi:hypothetical protein